MENARRARRHMQRATELLNQSQLGFGVETRSRQEPVQCGICHEYITREEEALLHACHPRYTYQKYPNEHWFHKLCLRPWINSGNTTCPICREECPDQRLNHDYPRVTKRRKLYGKVARWGKEATGR